jgi:guanylate kinase
MSPLARRGVCLVLSAPSGAGKTSLTRALLAAEPNLALSVSVTTRAPRSGEQEGSHYFFRTPEQFAAMIQAGEMLEWAQVFGQSYGTPRAPVEAALAAGRDVAFDIDWQGHRQLRAALPADVVGLFILPPSLPVLESRLRGRGTDNKEEIVRRMQAARSEIAHAPEFDHVLVNADFDSALAGCRAVLHAARSATHRLHGLPGFIAGLGA